MLVRFKSRYEQAEERIGELEYRIVEMIKYEEWKEKGLESKPNPREPL